MALVKNDDSKTGKMNDFEAAAAFIIPSDPVAKQVALGKKRGSAYISGVNDTSTNGGQVRGTTAGSGDRTSGKNASGKSGVEFRFYKHKEFHALNKEHKQELLEWRKKNQDKVE
eukprot:15095287-Ditylum_brightwellii.AAC.1